MSNDALIIGAGHNGLVAAAYLARAGLRVRILERDTAPGGAAKTFNWHGFETTFGATWGGMLDRGIMADFGLDDLKLGWSPLDPQIYAVDYNGRGVGMYLDSAKTKASFETLLGTSVADVLTDLHRFENESMRAAAILNQAFQQTSVHDRWAALSASSDVRQWLDQSVSEVLSRHHIPEPMSSAIAAGALSLTNLGPEAPQTAFALAYMATASAPGYPGAWSAPLPSMGETIRALSTAASKLGVRISYGAPVTSIVESNGTLRVGIDGGLVEEAPIVVWSAHPYGLQSVVADAAKWLSNASKPDRGSSATVRATIRLSDVEADFQRRLPSGQIDRSLFVCTGGDLSALTAAWRDVRDGSPISSEPLVTFSIKGRKAFDSTSELQADELLVEAYVQFVSWSCSDDLVIGAAQRAVCSIFPEAMFGDAIGFTPRDLETRCGLLGGHPEHLLMSFPALVDQRPSALLADYTTPWRGLFVGSAGSYPGGTVSGVPGRNVALAIQRAMETD